MTYSAPFLRVVMTGTTYAEETFSCGLSIAQNFDGPMVQPSDLQPYGDACRTWFVAPFTKISGLCKLRAVKVNLIGEDGLYVDKTQTGIVEYPLSTAGGGGVDSMAPQLTMAHTLRTAKRRGPAHVGRIFPPMTTADPLADGLITPQSAMDMANTLSKLINDLNALSQGVVSIVSAVGTGASEPVIGVEVGRVVDTQRRRRRSLPETRVPATTTITGFDGGFGGGF